MYKDGELDQTNGQDVLGFAQRSTRKPNDYKREKNEEENSPWLRPLSRRNRM